MCGIVGYVDFTDTLYSESILETMTESLRHRGPDSGDCFREPFVGLGHRRLSILDLSAAASQPFHSHDGRFVVVFNGEIYNFGELRRELVQHGYHFRTTSDTEVLTHGFHFWGHELLSRLNGIFAFAVWDRHEKSLTLARDRFGVKPCYYQLQPDGILFASETKAILEASRSPRQINPVALHEFFYYGNALGDQTLFDGIQKLTPGTFIRFSRSGIEQHVYWKIEDVPPLNLSENEAIEELRRRLEAAVASQLVSDVPIGVFLSGGIDSSCVTAFASKHYPGKLDTFSVSFDFEIHNELASARMMADRCATNHHEFHICGGDVSKTIEKLIVCHDEPFADAANIPLYLLCQQLNGSPKVILQGDGGDEMFAGYRRYSYVSLRNSVMATTRLGRLLHGLLPRTKAWHRRSRFMNAILERDPGLRMALLLTTEVPSETPLRILSPEWRRAVERSDPFAVYRRFNDRFAHLDPTQRMLFTDTGVILPQQFLEKVDKSTMAYGIESRVPLLDHRVTDFAMGIPSQTKVKQGQSKWLLKAALRGIVPDAILDAPKRGFGVPYSNWLRKPLAGFFREVVFSGAAGNKTLFDVPILERCLADHVNGRRDFGFLLWKVLNLALWCHCNGMYELADGGSTEAAFDQPPLRKSA